MGHAQFAFKKAEQQQQSSVTTLFTWRWLKQTAPTSLATLAGAAPPCVWRLMQQPAQQDWTNYRRTCKFTQDLAAHSYMYTHIQVHVLTCTRVVAKYFQRVRGRGTTNVNMHSNGGAASRAGVNVTKCCQTFARTLAWQRQNANVHTQFQVCVCVNREGGNGKSKCLIAFNGPL